MLPDEYKGLLEQLIPVYDSEDFENIFLQMAANLDGPTRLKIKMELHRIMALNHKAVDLRGRVKGECRPYQLHGKQHWLDDVAINIYQNRIGIFGGRFRVGLYEELHNTRNNFRVLHQNGELYPTETEIAASDDPQFDATLIRFGHYLSRNENRLQIATQAVLSLPFGQVVNATTSDISYSGAKFKVPASFNYQLGMDIHVSYPDLARQIQAPKLNDNTLCYRIIGLEDNNDCASNKWLRVRLLGHEGIIKDAINSYLNQTANRAKQNHNDKVLQARTRGYEHCYLKHSAGLPLFFSGNTLEYALLTQHNRPIWQYWHDERHQPVINQLFSPERLANLARPGMTYSSTLLYSFGHEYNNRSYFYSAALSELDSDERELFWYLGAQRSSWRVYRLTLQAVMPDDIEQLKHLAPDMVEQIKTLTHIGLLQDLSNPEAQQDYRMGNRPRLPPSALNRFRHQRNPVASAKGVFFDPKPQRSEERFLYGTPITLRSDTQQIAGRSIDFSSRGLNIQLKEPAMLRRGDTVAISFPRLQTINKQFPLSEIPYQIMRISPDQLNIRLQTGDGRIAKSGESFLRKLIKHNELKLVVSEERLPRGELLLAMHRMLLRRLNSVPYFTEKVDHKIRLKAIGSNTPFPEIIKLFQPLNDGDSYSLKSLFRNRIKTMLTETMRPVEVHTPFSHDLYCHARYRDGKLIETQSKLHREFADNDARIKFIRQAQENGIFMALKITAVPVHSPMTALISQEIGELARLTMHRAKTLESELSELVGCGEIIDITDEVLLRLGAN